MFSRTSRTPVEVSAPQRLNEGVHHRGEPVIQRARAHVDFGVLFLRARGGVSSIAAVVIGVDVEHHERSAFSDHVQIPAELRVEGVVDGEGAGDDGIVERRIADDIQPPRLLRGTVDTLFALAIQIHLESGPMHDDAGGDEGPDLGSVRVLFPQSVRFGKNQLRGEVRADVVPIVDSGGDELSIPAAEKLERGKLSFRH
jgi:hypothetical protein